MKCDRKELFALGGYLPLLGWRSSTFSTAQLIQPPETHHGRVREAHAVHPLHDQDVARAHLEDHVWRADPDFIGGSCATWHLRVVQLAEPTSVLGLLQVVNLRTQERNANS